MPIAPHALALPRARRERPHERRAADKANDEFRRFIGSPQELLNRGGRARRLRRYGAACAQQPCDLFLIAGAVELRLGQI